MRKFMSALGFAQLLVRINALKRGEFIYDVDTELNAQQLGVLNQMKDYAIVAVRANNDHKGKTPFFFCIGFDADREEMFRKVKRVLTDIGGKNIEITRNQ